MAEVWGGSGKRQDLTKVVGRRSRWQMEGLDLWMRSAISEESGCAKLETH